MPAVAVLFLERQPLETHDDLQSALHNAIAVELATIPPYLTALFSIRPPANAAAGAIIRSVVIEEMLHLSLACNMLNAVGGRPDLPAALLRYPSELPMGIGERPGGPPFVVGLVRLSPASIQTFMTIEEPEFGPLTFPGEAPPPDFHTIGQFYEAVAELMKELGPGVFTGARERQVSGWIGRGRLDPVSTLDDALQAIELIVDQGEGTATSPADADELAHYYRFEQIQKQETLAQDPSAPEGYRWGPPPIALDEAGVWPMIDNPPEVQLPPGSDVSRASDQFDGTFTALMNDLQRTFDGSPEIFGSAVAQMHALRLEAAGLVPLDVPGRDGTAGPRFLYVDGDG